MKAKDKDKAKEQFIKNRKAQKGCGLEMKKTVFIVAIAVTVVAS